MGVSENSVPLNPMVLLIIIPIKWLFHWEYTLFSDKPICRRHCGVGVTLPSCGYRQEAAEKLATEEGIRAERPSHKPGSIGYIWRMAISGWAHTHRYI